MRKRTDLSFFTQSYTVSTRKQAKLVTINDKNYFIEHKTNVEVDYKNLNNPNQYATLIEDEHTFTMLKVAFEKYQVLINRTYERNFLRFTDYLIGFMICVGIDLKDLNILR